MNRSKAKGTRYESEVVEFLRGHGFPWAERRALAGVNDKGDVTGIPGLVVEIKAHREMDLGSWMTEARRESIAAACWRYVVVHKRRAHNVRESYVTMPLWQFCELAGDADLLAQHVASAAGEEAV